MDIVARDRIEFIQARNGESLYYFVASCWYDSDFDDNGSVLREITDESILKQLGVALKNGEVQDEN